MSDELSKTLSRDELSNLTVLESTIEKGLGTFYEVGRSLVQIRDQKLYRADHKTFEEYCEQRWDFERAHAYRLMESAAVVDNIKTSFGAVGRISLPINERQARPLTQLPPEQQVDAWEKANEKTKGKPPSGGIVQAVVDSIRSKLKSPKPSKKAKHEDGFSKEQLEKDVDLARALWKIEQAWGKEDRKAIENGTVPLSRAEVVKLASISPTQRQEVQHLIMANHWGLEEALKFVNSQPDDDTTVAELKNHCLTTRGLYWTGSFNGFDVTVKATTAVKRKLS